MWSAQSRAETFDAGQGALFPVTCESKLSIADQYFSFTVLGLCVNTIRARLGFDDFKRLATRPSLSGEPVLEEIDIKCAVAQRGDLCADAGARFRAAVFTLNGEVRVLGESDRRVRPNRDIVLLGGGDRG